MYIVHKQVVVCIQIVYVLVKTERYNIDTGKQAVGLGLMTY